MIGDELRMIWDVPMFTLVAVSTENLEIFDLGIKPRVAIKAVVNLEGKGCFAAPAGIAAFTAMASHC